jgi:hypothetical protein
MENYSGMNNRLRPTEDGVEPWMDKFKSLLSGKIIISSWDFS